MLTTAEKLTMIETAWKKGRTVYLSTYTKSIRITATNAAKWKAAGRAIVKMSGESLYVARGRSYDCADYCAITID